MKIKILAELEKMKNRRAITKAMIVGGLALLLSCSGNKEKRAEGAAPVASIPVDTVEREIPPCKRLKISTSGALPIKSLPVVETIEFPDTTEYFIGVPSCVEVRGDTIFAIDSSKAPGFYAYRRDGSQIFAYTSTGQGPEDFMVLRNLNVTDTELSAFDDGLCGIFIIDKNGDFVRTVKCPVYSLAASISDAGDMWVDFSNFDGMMDDIKLGWAPPGGRPDSLVTVLPIPEHLKGIYASGIRPLVRISANEWIFTPSFERYVYTLKDGKAYPRYELDFGNLWWDDEKMSKMAHSNDWAVQLQDFPIQPMYIQENERWFVVGFAVNRDKRYVYVYDKLGGDSRTFIDHPRKYLHPIALDCNDLFMNCVDNSNLEVLRLAD
ncbi:MAG: 6-bladed beta-propeller [Bacteroides sp.]|nr:6-bladed beta-propeller [Bacteroides sp.]